MQHSRIKICAAQHSSPHVASVHLGTEETDVVGHRNSRRLIELASFGSNPGALKSWLYIPSIMTPQTPLVVALHGCTQTAAGYDHGTGWSQLAETKGFAVLFPEQQRPNNANLCFNWFEPGDTHRGAGEALSVAQMIEHVVESHGMDKRRIFITGLSAGGAMANVMLATYPELFGGGAIIGGIPYGVATNVSQAFERMQGRNTPDTQALRSGLPKAKLRDMILPRISVWHGTHDQTVKPINADQIASQWGGVHGTNAVPDTVESGQGFIRKVWYDKRGEVVIEVFMIEAMKHGVPLASGAKVPVGNVGQFMLETGISSTARIARSWGLASDADVADAEGTVVRDQQGRSNTGNVDAVLEKAMEFIRPNFSAKTPDIKRDGDQGVGKVINDALRAAGLMR